jgi:hypothetical protein
VIEDFVEVVNRIRRWKQQMAVEGVLESVLQCKACPKTVHNILKKDERALMDSSGSRWGPSALYSKSMNCGEFLE